MGSHGGKTLDVKESLHESLGLNLIISDWIRLVEENKKVANMTHFRKRFTTHCSLKRYSTWQQRTKEAHVKVENERN